MINKAKNLLVITMLCMTTSSIFAQTDLVKTINQAFTEADTKVLATILAEEVTLSLFDDEQSMSKEETLAAVSGFFSEHPVSSFEHKHDGQAKDGSSFAIGEILVGEETYRTYVVIIDEKIAELCIDLD